MEGDDVLQNHQRVCSITECQFVHSGHQKLQMTLVRRRLKERWHGPRTLLDLLDQITHVFLVRDEWTRRGETMKEFGDKDQFGQLSQRLEGAHPNQIRSDRSVSDDHQRQGILLEKRQQSGQVFLGET